MTQLVGKNGHFLTEALFWETNRNREAYAPLFTLKDREHEGLPSLKQIYLSHRDPTEYKFAMAVFGSLDHWEQLKSLSWFAPYAESWNRELNLLLRSEAANAMLQILADPDASPAAKTQAAKYVSEGGWNERQAKGRPKKADIQKAAREHVETNKHWDDDFARIMN